MNDRAKDVLLAEQRDSWANGEPTSVEQYRARWPELASDREALLDLIYQEIDLREQHGDTPALAEYLRRFPELADELRRLFEVHAALSDDNLIDELPNTDDDEFPHLDGYEIRERLGSGTFGVVYRAWQPSLHRDVALKLLRDGAAAEAEDKASLRREAQAVARLQHPNIVRIYEIGDHAGCPFFALEYVADGSLEQLLNHEPQPPYEAAGLVETLARAVHYAHQRKLIHCDLKPANVLLQRKSEIRNPKSEIRNPKSEIRNPKSEIRNPKHTLTEFEPKITDFGLARKFDASTGMFSGTATGVRAGQGGTLSYMAPEQAGGLDAKVGPAADVHALGAILYEMLTGRPPFIDRSLLELVMQLRDRDPVPPRSLIPATPRDLETICLKCLRKEPLKRYASAAELAEDLRRFQAHEPIRARPVGLVGWAWRWCRRNPVVAALAVVLFGIVIAAFWVDTAALFQAQDERDAKEKARKAEKDRADELAEALDQQHFLLAFRDFQQFDVGAANPELNACQPQRRRLEWYLLKQLCAGPKRTIDSTEPGGMSLSADGRRAAVVQLRLDSSVNVLDLTTGKVLFTAPNVAQAALSRDGRRVAGLTGGGNAPPGVAVWDVESGRQLWSQRPAQDRDALHAVAFLDGGKTVLVVASGLRDGRPSEAMSFSQWKTDTGERLAAYDGPLRDGGTHLSLSLDGTRLAWMTSLPTAFGKGVEVLLCDTTTGKQIGVLTGHARRVQHTAFSPDNHLAATSSDDGTVKLWEVDTSREIATLNGNTSDIHALAFSGDGRTLAIAGEDYPVRTREVRSGDLLGVFRGHRGPVWALAALPDGGFVSAGEDDRVLVWGTQPPGTFSVRIAGAAANSGVFLASGSLVTGHAQFVNSVPSGSARFIDPDGRREGRVIEGWWQFLTATPDGRRLAAFDSKDVRVWDAAEFKVVATLPAGVRGPLAFAAAGTLLVGVLGDGNYRTLVIADAATGEERARLEAPEGVRALAAARDGSRVAAGCLDGSVMVFDAVAGRAVTTFKTGQEGGAIALALRADGEELLTAGLLERTVAVRDAGTGKEKFRLTGHTKTVDAVAYSPDSLRILTGSEDRTVKVWDAATGQELVTLRDCTKPVRWVAFSADGRQLAAGGSANSSAPGSEVVIWDARPLDAPR